ncbi:MAG: hypothetical protein AAF487_07800 [Bacteroidota bacterium]
MLKNKAFQLFRGIFSNSKKIIYLIFGVYLLYGLYFGNWRTESIIQHDVIIYYEYLTATFMFNDLSFEFASQLPEKFDGEIWLSEGEDGEFFPKMTMGVSIMLTPFYLIAYLINKLEVLGSFGYSAFFQFFVFLAAMIYAILAAIFQRKILTQFFNDRVVCLVLISIFLCTNLFYYTIVESGMSHVYSFFLYTLLIYMTIEWHKNQSLKNSAVMGLVMGLIILVRPTNVVAALIPICYGLFTKAGRENKVNILKEKKLKVAFAIVLCCLLVSLQFLFWKYSTGKWFIYGYSDEGFFFLEPKFIDTLFSFRKGFLTYAPILILAISGIFLARNMKDLRLPLIIFLILNLYIVSSWWCWWYGGSYGQRALIETIAVLAIFFGFFYQWLLKKSFLIRTATIILIGFFFVQNTIQMMQYKKAILHWHGMTYDAYKNIFFKLEYPENYSDYIVEPDYDAAMKGDR